MPITSRNKTEKPTKTIAGVVKVAGIQMASSPQVASNLIEAKRLIALAAAQGAKIVVLPEYFCIMGVKETDKVQVREIPNNFSLSQNYPNPFNPTTNINYSIPQDASVKLTVYNSLGQIVKTMVDAQQKAGYYSVRWDGSNDMGSKVSSGMYIYRITAGSFTHAVKMNLIK